MTKRLRLANVVSQNPRAGKRVNRDVAVSLVVSDGMKPKPEGAPEDNIGNRQPNPGGEASPETSPSGSTSPADLEPRTAELIVTVKPDGGGRRRVRIEYDDLRGHTLLLMRITRRAMWFGKSGGIRLQDQCKGVLSGRSYSH